VSRVVQEELSDPEKIKVVRRLEKQSLSLEALGNFITETKTIKTII
jgi:hypothetical protein